MRTTTHTTVAIPTASVAPVRGLWSSIFARVGVAEWVLALSLFILAAGLRLYCLDCHGLWYDESISVEIAQGGFDAIFNQRFGWLANQTPWHYLLVWLAIQPIDPTTTTVLVRLPSVLAGIFTVLLTYGIGRILFGRMAGAFAALLVSLSVTSLDYSQDLRPYALVTCFTAASVFCLLMAARTGAGAGRWWGLFVLAAIADLYISYATLTMVMPTLLAVFVLVIFTLRRGGGEGGKLRPFVYPLLSLFAIALAALPIVADVARIPGTAPDLSMLTPGGMANTIYSYLTWFTRFGLSTQVESLASFGLMLLSTLGFYVSIHKGSLARSGACLCWLFVLLPLAELTVLGTTRVGMPRYVLFVMPFYFLLIGNALSAILGWAAKAAMPPLRKSALLLASLITGTTLLLFGMGAYNYYNPQVYGRLTERTDFREPLSYLQAKVKPNDTIIFASNPTHSLAVSRFYWKDAPPAAVYYALDPRLFVHKVEGDVYWVVSTWGMDQVGPPLLADEHWSERTSFNGVIVLKERSPSTDIVASADYLASRLQTISPYGRLGVSLRGSVYQARGDVAGAVATYKQGGAYITLWQEHVNTYKGFAALGDSERA